VLGFTQPRPTEGRALVGLDGPGDSSIADGLPVVWVVCRSFGRLSEAWLWRQVMTFRQVRPHVLCWDYENADAFPVDGIDVQKVGYPAAPEDGASRWLHRLINMPGGNFYGSNGPELHYLSNLFREQRPGAILCHFGHIALRILPVAKRMRVPLIAHFHGVDASASLRNRWYRWSIQHALPEFSAVVVVGDHQKEWVLKQGISKERVQVIPCGVPASQFSPRVHSDAGTCRFLFVGRFVPKKAPLTTIRAFGRCLETGATARLTMIGDGPLLREAQDLVRALGLQDHAELVGEKSNEEVLCAMQRSSAYVQHSVTSADGDTEGWPVAIAEAAACGLPVVATRHAGIVTQVVHGRTGFLVDEHDELMMSQHMLTLARSPDLRRRMGEAGRSYMCNNFDSSDQVRKLETVLLSALGK
jgi:colanic acid/amylovoran biosynthesis glycosyltransferase